MTSAQPKLPPLKLVPTKGPDTTRPDTETITIEPGAGGTIGRSLKCKHTLSSEAVSRHHASIVDRGERWVLTDLGSRHGTWLNAQAMPAHEPQVLGDGDVIGIGPYSFRVNLGGAHLEHVTSTTEDHSPSTLRIEAVAESELAPFVRQRMDLLVDCASRIHGADSEPQLAEAVLKSALAGTGFHHAALLRPRGSDAIEIIGHEHQAGMEAVDVQYSRSLINKASEGKVVRLTEAAQVTSQSIVDLGITGAICAPIMLGPSLAAYLYLDARGGEAPREADSAGFCQVIARMCGLAMANLKRVDLERRKRELDEDIDAAREAQVLIVPAPEGLSGPIRYAMQMRPGHFVAGDCFDVINLDERRTAVCIGDVTGEGVGAAVIMAATQSHLHGAIQRTGDPATAVNDVNRYVAKRTAVNKFVSLWVGLFDANRNELTYVDAGHGYWEIKTADDREVPPSSHGDIPLGIEPSYEYQAVTIPISPGDRVLMYSDGVVEQRSSDGEQFGRERATQAIAASTSPAEDVQLMMKAVEEFAGRPSFDDDTTVASVEVL